MDKHRIIEEIVRFIESELEGAKEAAIESAESATDDESKQEGKYDTRGLETSYLASAQAHYAQDLIESLDAYHNLHLPENPRAVALGCVVTTLSTSGREFFFVGPAHGGIEVQIDEQTAFVITPQSPIGRELIGKNVGGKTNDDAERTVIRIA